MSEITFALAPPPGLNSDDTTYAQPGTWALGSGVRFENGRPASVGSQIQLGNLSGNRIWDMFAFWRAGASLLAYGLNGAIFVGGASAPDDRSPSPAPLDNQGWSFADWGDVLLAAERGGTLYEQSGSGAATAVTEAPDNIGCILQLNRQVMAFNTNEELSGARNGLCIRWSDFEDYSSAGSWSSSSANNAGEYILDGPGEILAAAKFGSSPIVWTSTSLWLGQFIGDPGQTYRFDRVADNCGIMSPRAYALTDSAAYWMSTDGKVRMWSPGATPETLPCPIYRDWMDNGGRDGQPYSFMVHNRAHDELWFHYIDPRDPLPEFSNPNRYIAVSLADGAWFQGSLDAQAALDSSLVRSVLTGYGTSIIVAAGDGGLCASDIPGSGAVGSYIQTSDIYLEKGQRRVMFSEFIPDFETLFTLASLTIYTRDHPRSTTVTTHGPYFFDDTTKKKSLHLSGRLAAFRFTQTNGAWVMGTPVFRGVTMGER